MTLGVLIKEYRDSHSMNMQDFAKLCGLSKAYISILERNFNPKSGKPPIPSLETIRAISTAIGKDFNEVIALLDGDQMVSLTPSSTILSGIFPMPTLVKKPRLGDIACGKPILAVEDAEDFDMVPEDIECDFTLRCKGDSMINARIFDGDTVYIRSQPEVENGEIAAVRIGDEATLKKVYYTPGSDRITLRACNPMYPDLVYDGEALNEIEILGKAVAFTSLIKT